MAGHSKSSNIKHRKNAQDAKRSRLFTKFAREVLIAARDNPDFSQNPRLRLARNRALAANIRKETIEKAIKTATTSSNSGMESVRYEGYGPERMAILVDTFTDNRKRTTSDVRSVLSRHDGKLGVAGSVSWSFFQKGIVTLARSFKTESELVELGLAVGAEDIVFSHINAFASKLITSKGDLEKVVTELEQQFICIEEAVLAWIPKNRVLISDTKRLDKLQNCITALQALSDVESVYTSCDWQLI